MLGGGRLGFVDGGDVLGQIENTRGSVHEYDQGFTCHRRTELTSRTSASSGAKGILRNRHASFAKCSCWSGEQDFALAASHANHVVKGLIRRVSARLRSRELTERIAKDKPRVKTAKACAPGLRRTAMLFSSKWPAFERNGGLARALRRVARMATILRITLQALRSCFNTFSAAVCRKRSPALFRLARRTQRSVHVQRSRSLSSSNGDASAGIAGAFLLG